MNKVIEYLKGKIDKDDYVVVAVSGGPDSMALLTLTRKVCNHVVCAHINHNIRAVSKDEAIFVKDYCHKIDVIFEQTEIKNYSDENFHKQARDFRYQYFEDIVNKYGAKYLLTAHHGDDLMETILMRLVRGSSLKGYSGFKRETVKNNYTILRPFIMNSKDEIENYDKSVNIPYVIDNSNYKDKYTRNRYRKKVLPFLKSENKNVIKKFNDFSCLLEQYENYVLKIASIEKDKVYQANVLNIDLFLTIDKLIQKEIINLILLELYQERIYLINDNHVKLIMELINSSKTNTNIYLPNNLKMIKTYNICEFSFDELNIEEYNIELKEVNNLPNGKNIVIIDDDVDSNYLCRLNSNEISLPLYIRTRNNGDKMLVKNMDGHKKINDIFIDNKIPLNQRKNWPIVVDSNNTIVWLPGLKKSILDKSEKGKYDIVLKYY